MALSFNIGEQNRQAQTKDKVDDTSSLSYPQPSTSVIQRSNHAAAP
jgi:hypothetical protein